EDARRERIRWARNPVRQCRAPARRGGGRRNDRRESATRPERWKAGLDFVGRTLVHAAEANEGRRRVRMAKLGGRGQRERTTGGLEVIKGLQRDVEPVVCLPFLDIGGVVLRTVPVGGGQLEVARDVVVRGHALKPE